VKANDRRSRRVALVADAVMNPVPGKANLLALVAARDWGIVGLLPERLGQPAIRQWMAGVADQVAEFRRHGMVVVAVLDPAEITVIGELEQACAGPPALVLPVHMLGPRPDDLAAFLDRRAG